MSELLNAPNTGDSNESRARKRDIHQWVTIMDF